MLIKFPRFTDEDLKGNNQFDESNFKIGLVSFTVNKIEQTQSKSGNPMLKVNLKLIDDSFVTAYCFDYFVLTDTCKWKLRTFFDAISITASTNEILKNGEFDSLDLLNKEGKCECVKEEFNGQYRIKIKAYINSNVQPPVSKLNKTNGEFDDSIPF